MTPLEEQWPTETPERAVMDAFSAFRGRDVARLAALTDAPATSVLDDLMTRLPEVFTDSVRCFVMGHVDVAYVVFRPGFELPGQGVVPLPSELQIATTRRVDGEWKLVLDEESDVRLPGFRGVGFWVDEKASHLDRESRR